MNTLTAGFRRGEGAAGPSEKVFVLGKDAEIIVDGKKGTLAQLGKECSLRIWLQEGTADRILRIEATGQRLGGRRGVSLRLLDAGKKTLTLRTNDPSLDKIYDVSDDVKVVQDGKPGSLADLSLRRAVYLQLAADMKTVIAIQQGDPERDRRELARERRIFKYTDRDQNGRVSFEEYFALSEGKDDKSRARWQATFNRGDRDGDGAWSQSEFIMARTGRSESDLGAVEGRVRREGDREGREGEVRRDRTRDRE